MGYIAFVLDEQSRSEVLNKIKPRYDRLLTHHVTLSYHIDWDSGTDMVDSFATLIDTISVIGIMRTEHFDVAVVAVNGLWDRYDDSIFHVVVSTNTDTRLILSDLSTQEFDFIEPINLAGSVQYFDQG